MRSSQNITIFVVLVFLYLCHVQCVKSTHKSVSSKEDDTENGSTHHHGKHDSDLPHKLERAPIPAVHTGPQPLKLEIRSAPIALDHRYDSLDKGDTLERVNRHISAADNSPNPQKPSGWNGIQKENKTNDNSSTYFYHPGHTQNSNHPSNVYNYYSILKTYGSAYQYGSKQPFKGYMETANIGVIPPRNVNAKGYYNTISGFKDLPMVGQHSDSTFQSLYGNKKFPIYGYGYGSRDYVKNAYKNVLTGLVMWNIMNGLTNGRKYSIYNHTTLPQDFPKHMNLPNNTITDCLEEVSILCQNHAEPLCTDKGSTYCVTSAVISCQNKYSNTCVNITIPCEDCEDGESNYLPCAANITIVNENVEGGNVNKGEVDGANVILCVTTLIVPKETDRIPSSCSDSNCLDSNRNNGLENTTMDTSDGKNVD